MNHAIKIDHWYRDKKADGWDFYTNIAMERDGVYEEIADVSVKTFCKQNTRIAILPGHLQASGVKMLHCPSMKRVMQDAPKLFKELDKRYQIGDQ